MKPRRPAFALLALLALAAPAHLSAFGPAAHIVILEKMTGLLPAGSFVRQSLELHPAVGRAGANGPDINYASFRGLLTVLGAGYAPWADRYHYHLVGSLAAAQIREALASRDPASVAWAAGWITHVAGDLFGHGAFVNPEAGVFLDNPAGADVHHELESAAEPYVWITLGGHSPGSYSSRSLPGSFCDAAALPASLLGSVSKRVYGVSADPDDFRSWYRTYLAGLGAGLGYSYVGMAEALEKLRVSDREARLRSAVDAAVRFAVDLVNAAERSDWSVFSDAWNLDAAVDRRPIGTLTVTVGTADDIGSGTDADIWFGLVLTDGRAREWPLDKSGYNDLETGDNDEYYLFLQDAGFDPGRIAGAYLRMGQHHGAGNDWKCRWIRVTLDGVAVADQAVDTWLRDPGDRYDFALRVAGS